MGTGERHRPVLADLLNAMRRVHKRKVWAVEVGVANGETSRYLLENVPDLVLVMVDSWREKRAAACTTATNVTAGKNRLIVHQDSISAAQVLGQMTGDHVFDLVFIDAGHDYLSVALDLDAWWPLVRYGGIFCGHDILSPRNDTGQWGVKRAVEEFSQSLGVKYEVMETIWVMDKVKV